MKDNVNKMYAFIVLYVGSDRNTFQNDECENYMETIWITVSFLILCEISQWENVRLC